MKLHIDLRKLPWDFHDKTDLPHVKQKRERLHAMFADYAPRRLTEPNMVHTHELIVPADDGKVDALLKQLDQELRQSKQSIAAEVRKLLEPAEVKRARYIALTVYGDSVDVNKYGEPLNPVALACEACKFPEITHVPDPLLVNKALIKKAGHLQRQHRAACPPARPGVTSARDRRSDRSW